jgi:hypothetical protein
MAGILTAQFLLSTEILATMTLFGAMVLLCAYAVFPLYMARMRTITIATMAAYAIAFVMVSPYLYYMWAFGAPQGPINSPDQFATDLRNVLIPSSVSLLGGSHRGGAVSHSFVGSCVPYSWKCNLSATLEGLHVSPVV